MFAQIRSLYFFSLKEIWLLCQNKLFKNVDGSADLTFIRHLIRDILNAGSAIKISGSHLVIKHCSGLNFLARKKSSDLQVYRQIWVYREYKPVLDYLQKKKIEVKTIIDCGANVGYTTLYFSTYFKGAHIVSVEADKGNAEMVCRNIKLNNVAAIQVLHKAIWYRAAMLKVNNTFRDGKNWSYTVEETADVECATVDAISIQDITEKYNWSFIDLLKMDIEGSERYLFQNNYYKTFLPKVKCLVIEIHDEFNIRPMICNVLKQEGFEWTEAGEFTIAFNSRLI